MLYTASLGRLGEANYVLSQFYPIAMEAGDDTHAYGVTVPDLPDCFSASGTLDEDIANAKEAITGLTERLIKMGQDIPSVSPVGQLAKGSEYAGYTWAAVDSDVTRLMGGSEKINVTLPKSLINRIDRGVASNTKFQSRSGFLAQAALEHISSVR